MAIERRYKRAAERLHLYDLTAGRDEDLTADPTREASAARLVELYTPEGVRRALETYGVSEALAAMGLGDFDLQIEQTDRFRSRLHVTVEHEGASATVCDLRVHLVELSLHGFEEPVGAVEIDWLTMQNPRAAFTADKPRLPGQVHPGTGLGRSMHNLLQLMCLRLGRGALVTTPERWHLAALYARGGYRFRSVDRQQTHDAVSDALRGYHFAAAAWAVDLGLVAPEGHDEPYRYEAEPMVLALNPTTKHALAVAWQTIRRSWSPPRARFVVDEDRLRAALRERGLDAVADDRMYRWAIDRGP